VKPRNTRRTRKAATKILSRKAVVAERQTLRRAGKTLVFTNGAFDILHAGHVTYLEFARRQGDALVVGLNSDASVRRYKGPSRPINSQRDRAKVLASLECVDYVVIFGEDEQKQLIGELLPDVLVKGADWSHYVSGREVVEQHGGRVVLAKIVKGRSTTGTIEKVLNAGRLNRARARPRTRARS
jgi:D-glycero-beta-D-manno-heptose 1-phosphate adenylyltransferase